MCEWCNERLASICMTIMLEPLNCKGSVERLHKVCEPCVKASELNMGTEGLLDELREEVS